MPYPMSARRNFHREGKPKKGPHYCEKVIKKPPIMRNIVKRSPYGEKVAEKSTT